MFSGLFSAGMWAVQRAVKEIVLVPAADASPQVRGALALLPSAGGDQEWEREGVCGREVSE